MAKRDRKYRWWIEYGAVMLVIAVLRVLPWGLAKRLVSGLAWFFFYLIPKRRRITLYNLEQAFKYEKSRKEIRSIAKRSYQHLAYSVLEFSKVSRMELDEIASRVKVVGDEHLKLALKGGRGVIGITCHLGNWEFGNVAHAIVGGASYMLARPLDNPHLNRFVNKQRERSGSRIINSKKPGVVRQILKALHQGQSVGFLIDQNVTGGRGVFVDFFGKLAYTHKVAAIMAQRTGAPVIPAFSIREKDGTHRLIYEKPVDLITTNDKNYDQMVNTQRMTRIIEGWIRSYPEQWLWMHDRWKKKPHPATIPIRNRAIFLDRDGTITKEIGYVDDIEKFELMEHSAEAIRLLNKAGIKVIVVTNQSGVARGFFTETHVQEVNKKLKDLLEAEGAYLDGILYCPHHPTEGTGAYTFSCGCRKPEPGLLYHAEESHNVRLSQSWMVGDKLTDIELARRIGAKGIMVLTGYGQAELEKANRSGMPPDFSAPDLLSAVHWIIKNLQLG